MGNIEKITNVNILKYVVPSSNRRRQGRDCCLELQDEDSLTPFVPAADSPRFKTLCSDSDSCAAEMPGVRDCLDAPQRCNQPEYEVHLLNCCPKTCLEAHADVAKAPCWRENRRQFAAS